jgi:hypothetical protein
MKEQDIPGILLLIDFEKAFDSIPPFNYSIREVIINPPNLNNSYYFPFLCGVI